LLLGFIAERIAACAAALHNTSGQAGERARIEIHCADFLTCNGDLGTFDRIVMRPPFSHAVDIQHIHHALSMLRSGGVLVALCANGPRQRAALQPLAEVWEDLPQGTFREAGTLVNVALLRITKEAAA
jgi:16S rRNA G1207 methylase RsmC